jgi:pilus assembly protein CpaB
MAITTPTRPSRATPAMRRPLFLVGIGTSVLAFILVLVLGNSLSNRVVTVTAETTIVVAAHDIGRRMVIGPADLTTTRVPLAAAPPAAMEQSSQAVGRVAQVNVLKGQPITTNLVSSAGSGEPAYLPIPAGWDAITIPAGELQAVGGFISPGDQLDMVVTIGEAVINPAAALPRSLTRTTLRNIRVIRVGPAPNLGLQTQAVTTSLTVLVTPCDATYLTWLQANAIVRYTLVSPIDYAPAPTGPDPSCPAGTVPVRVGPAEVDKRFSFVKG